MALSKSTTSKKRLMVVAGERYGHIEILRAAAPRRDKRQPVPDFDEPTSPA